MSEVIGPKSGQRNHKTTLELGTEPETESEAVLETHPETTPPEPVTEPATESAAGDEDPTETPKKKGCASAVQPGMFLLMIACLPIAMVRRKKETE